MRPRIVVTRRLPSPIEERLRGSYDTVCNNDDHQFDAPELAAALRDADIVLCTLGDRLTREVFAAADGGRARLLANFGVGYNHIDLPAAREHRVAVSNTPGVLTEDTADLTILLLLAVARRADEGARELRRGEWTGWRPTHLLGRRVSGRTLGIIGFGRIGQAVARRAFGGLRMRVQYTSRRRATVDVEAETGASSASSLSELLATSDFVSLHCPASPETFHLIDDAALERMQRSAFLVNTSRGDVVDQEALIRALQGGVIAGAGLDVYEGEPAIPAELMALPNAVLLPHLGSATEESRVAMGMCVVDNIDAFVRGDPPPNRIL